MAVTVLRVFIAIAAALTFGCALIFSGATPVFMQIGGAISGALLGLVLLTPSDPQ